MKKKIALSSHLVHLQIFSNIFNLLSAHQDNFYYLNQGECPYVDEVDDGEGFEEMREAMDLVGIMNDEQLMIFRILAGILHIGNIDIQPASEEESTINVRLCSVFFTLVISVILGPFHTSEKSCLFGQIFCHHQHFTSVDGLS